MICFVGVTQSLAHKRQHVAAIFQGGEQDRHQNGLGCRAGFGAVAAPDFAVDDRRADGLFGFVIGRVDSLLHAKEAPCLTTIYYWTFYIYQEKKW